jgi:hypothetical protein
MVAVLGTDASGRVVIDVQMDDETVKAAALTSLAFKDD